jgi:hypothetical protein
MNYLRAYHAGMLIAIDAASERVLSDGPLSSLLDVIFLQSSAPRSAIASGDPTAFTASISFDLQHVRLA